jgi:hypothetical protein
MQPMLANYLPTQWEDRAEELDFVARLVHTRMQSLKYLLHGTWLHPPALDREIDVAEIGVYTPLKASRRSHPLALAGAWRAPHGDVGIALASIADQPLSLQLPIDAQAYGLPERSAVYRIDEMGRRPLGAFDRRGRTFPIELPARGVCVVEFVLHGSVSPP